MTTLEVLGWRQGLGQEMVSPSGKIYDMSWHSIEEIYDIALQELLGKLKNSTSVMLNMMHDKIAKLSFDEWQRTTGDMSYGKLPEKTA